MNNSLFLCCLNFLSAIDLLSFCLSLILRCSLTICPCDLLYGLFALCVPNKKQANPLRNKILCFTLRVRSVQCEYYR